MPNIPEAIISVYALNKMGAIPNLIHPLKSQNEIKFYVNETKSKYLLTYDSNYEKIMSIDNELNLSKIIIASASNYMPIMTKIIYKKKFLGKEKFYKEEHNTKYITWKEFIKEGVNTEYATKNYEKNELAVIIHTGGTTGNSKAVKLSNDNINSMVAQFLATNDGFSIGDRMLTIMPIFHGFGLCSSIHLPLSVGVTLVLIPKFEAKRFHNLLKKYKPNHIIGVPTLFKAMIQNEKIKKMDLSHLKYVVTGGDIMTPKFENEINTFLTKHNANTKLYKGYGMSETVAGATFSCKKANELGSIGIPMVKTDFKIVKPNTDQELECNQVGEFCISGPTVMLGYYNNEVANKKALIRDGAGKIWLHTGDIGYMDKNGILYYKQRNERMFISSGINIYPSSIEKLIASIKEIDKCIVIGKNHEYKGKVPKAYVVKKKEIIDDAVVLLKIQKECELNLDRYHKPYEIEFIDEIPYTDIGKINYKLLEEKTNKI